MIHNVRFSGLSLAISDLECPDGQLESSYNIIYDHGALRPIRPPKANHWQPPQGFTPVLLHNVDNRTMAILATGQTGAQTLYWAEVPEHGGELVPSQRPLSTEPLDIRQLAVFGRMVVAACASGLQFFLWQHPSYMALGNRPPFLPIEFALRIHDRCSVPRSIHLDFSHADIPSHKEQFTNAALGPILKTIAEQSAAGRFTQPFLVRYAYRLYTGDYIMHSSPVLMLPSCMPPAVMGLGADGYVQTPSRAINNCTLQFRLAERLSIPTAWSQIIESVDVFASAPIWTFMQDQQLDASNINYSASFDGIYATDDKADENHDSHIQRPYSSSSTRGLLPPNPSFDAQVRECATFYRIASLPLRALDSSSTTFRDLPLVQQDLTNLVHREVLPLDFRAHHIFTPSVLHAYNNRLHLADFSYDIPAPLPIVSCMQRVDDGNPQVATAIVRSRVNGAYHCAISSLRDVEGVADANLSRSCSMGQLRHLMYYYHPDPAAYEIEINNGLQSFTIPLQPHPTLNGSYFYRPFGLAAAGPLPAQELPLPEQHVSEPNKVYVSDIDTPFVFNPQYTVSIPYGQIYALSTAAKALSQGQFGQFPLYLFSDQGVWAVEITTSGTYSARQPIMRDIAYRSSITQLDSMVAFATARGIMLLAGSEASCISDDIFPPDQAFDMPDLSDTTILFDYFKRWLYVNTHLGQAYVYSLYSSTWAQLLSVTSAMRSLNSYPLPLAVDANGTVYNFALRNDTSVPVSMATRPIKMSDPSALKTLNCIILQGNLDARRPHRTLSVLGSRDLINWRPIWNSHSLRISDISGTPYRYFKVLYTDDMDPTESIHSVSMSYSIRMANRLR